MEDCGFEINSRDKWYLKPPGQFNHCHNVTEHFLLQSRTTVTGFSRFQMSFPNGLLSQKSNSEACFVRLKLPNSGVTKKVLEIFLKGGNNHLLLFYSLA